MSSTWHLSAVPSVLWRVPIYIIMINDVYCGKYVRKLLWKNANLQFILKANALCALNITVDQNTFIQTFLENALRNLKPIVYISSIWKHLSLKIFYLKGLYFKKNTTNLAKVSNLVNKNIQRQNSSKNSAKSFNMIGFQWFGNCINPFFFLQNIPIGMRHISCGTILFMHCFTLDCDHH